MEEKTKIVIILLVGLLSISLFINLQIYNAKKTAERERNALQNENKLLDRKIEEILKDNKQLKENINSLNSDLERISKEREEILGQYELIVKERDELLEKLKTQPIRKTQIEPPETDDVYWAEILKKKTELSLQVENLQSELKTLQADNEQLKRDFDSLTVEKEELEKELSYNQKIFDNAAAEFVLEKRTRRQFQDDLKSIKKENVALKQELNTLNRRKIYLEKKVAQLQEDKSNLERRFNEMSLMVEDIYKISEPKEPEKESVELPPIVVRSPTEVSRSEQEQETAPAIEGSILGVSEENNFVIIDLGEDSGIKVGNTFQVYREGKEIATIEVIQTRSAVAACNIKEADTPIKIGDIIR